MQQEGSRHREGEESGDPLARTQNFASSSFSATDMSTARRRLEKLLDKVATKAAEVSRVLQVPMYS